MFSLPDYMTDDRLEEGYVIVLPGIEGYSHWNKNIVRGLVAAGVPYGIEIYDWTLGRFLTLYNYFARKRQRVQTQILADKIADYRSRYPGRPVYLIGHSGGGAMSILTLHALPTEVQITKAILIGAAISRHHDLRPVLQRTTDGIVNISSWGDLFFLGGSTLTGNIDGQWTFAAGLSGFSSRVHQQVLASDLPPLVEIPYQWRFAMTRNFGGHFGAVAPPFVQQHIAPVIYASDQGLPLLDPRHQMQMN